MGQKGGRWCAAPQCRTNSKQHKTSFFSFPADEERSRIWRLNSERLDLLDKTVSYCNKNCKLCPWHFEDKMFLNNLKNRLQPHAVPTKFRWLTETNMEHEEVKSLSPSPSTSAAVYTDLSQPPVQMPHVSTAPLKAKEEEHISSTSADVRKFTTFSGTPSRGKMERLSQSTSTSAHWNLTTSSIQTPRLLTADTPRKRKLRRQLQMERTKLGKLCKQMQSPPQESLIAQIAEFKKLCDVLLPTNLANFVKSQVNLSCKKKVKHYSIEYKQFALTIYFLSPQAYKFLSKTFCLPSTRTLKRMTEKWSFGPGLNDFLFKALQLKINSMTEDSKTCFICVDEMSLKSNLFYDIRNDEIVGVHHVNKKKNGIAKFAVVLMVRAIHANWKLPIVYGLTESACSGDEFNSLIFSSIEKLNSIGLNIKAVVSDIGSNFYNFTRTLKITPKNPFFEMQGKKIFYFFDTPHLIKALRNNFFKYIFKHNDDIIDKKYINMFYVADEKQNFRSAYKLTYAHVYPNAFQKMKVKLATQLFSASVSAGMSVQMALGILPASAARTIDFIDKVDKIFDLLNSSKTISPKKYNCGFTGAQFQINFINEMENMFRNIKVIAKTTDKDVTNTIKCLKCWQISLAALKGLWGDLNCGILHTRRINQDCLENFFGKVRKQGGNCLNPTPIQFQRAFKKLFCLKYFEHAENANSAEDFDEVLTYINNVHM